MTTSTPQGSGATAVPVTSAGTRRGPHAPTLAVSVLGLLIAAAVLAIDVWHPQLDPAAALPWLLLVAGVVLVACGLPGIVARRRSNR